MKKKFGIIHLTSMLAGKNISKNAGQVIQLNLFITERQKRLIFAVRPFTFE